MGAYALFLPRRIQHVLNKDAIPQGWVIDQDVGHGADEFAVLQYGAAGHALDDAAGQGQKFRVGDFQKKIPVGRPVFWI